MKDKTIDRYWEIDFLRGIAIIMMIIYHIIFDLNYFNILSINLHSFGFRFFLYIIGTTFLLLVGISLSLSYSRIKDKLTKRQRRLKYLKRGFFIFGLGMIITFVTIIYPGDGFIIFGVLHCIGISIILSYFLLGFVHLNLMLGFLLIVGGFILNNMNFDFYYLLPLGFKPYVFYTLDYFPLLPWFGVVLIGIYVGRLFYADFNRRSNVGEMENMVVARLFCLLGRNSLIIYFIHQIVIIGIIYFLLA
jgi:uncharacterized membrane protein